MAGLVYCASALVFRVFGLIIRVSGLVLRGLDLYLGCLDSSFGCAGGRTDGRTWWTGGQAGQPISLPPNPKMLHLNILLVDFEFVDRIFGVSESPRNINFCIAFLSF